jgi:hypothetical protein
MTIPYYTCRKDVSEPGEPQRLCLKPTTGGARLCPDCLAQEAKDQARRAAWPFWPTNADEARTAVSPQVALRPAAIVFADAILEEALS